MSREAWLWTALTALAYLAPVGVVVAIGALPTPDAFSDQPLGVRLAVVGGVGLLLLVPATLAMGRLQLWILPRNAMGLPAGPPPFNLRIRDVVRVGWGMSRGDGRVFVEHLERVRTGTPFGAVEGVTPMAAERLEAVREGARKGTARTTSFGFVAGAILVIPLMQTLPDSWDGMAPLAFVAIVMPLVVMLGVWPQVKRWTQGYLDWAEEAEAETARPTAVS